MKQLFEISFLECFLFSFRDKCHLFSVNDLHKLKIRKCFIVRLLTPRNIKIRSWQNVIVAENIPATYIFPKIVQYLIKQAILPTNYFLCLFLEDVNHFCTLKIDFTVVQKNKYKDAKVKLVNRKE